jgi:Fis family transcriptional regulator
MRDDEGGMSSELHDCVRRSLNRYFRDLDGQAPHAIYDMVLKSVERPMLEVVMKQAGGNQSAAAEMLGISRGTLRRLLTEHELL